MSIVTRVLLRFAARSVKVPPFEIGPCTYCSGSGTTKNSEMRVTSTCARCFGTGSDPKAVTLLEAEVSRLRDEYEKRHGQFQQAKPFWVGRGTPAFGQIGKDLQTIRIVLTSREEQAKLERARINFAKHLALVVGAAAR